MGSLDRLLRPRSIAVIGGGVWGGNVILSCRRTGFAGEIWPVHPTDNAVAGLRAFPSIGDLPDIPDAAYVAVNRSATVAVVRELSTAGAGGAVCFASGFREATAELGDGASLEDALLEAAGEMRILGPNCYGLVNMLDRAALWPDQHGLVPVDRGVAILTQSSNIALNISMHKRGLPIAYLGTLGNQAQTAIAELGSAMLEDPRVTALGLHVEGIGDLARMEALSRTARHLGKPVVVLKVGKSDQARAATQSHTASLAGSDAGAGALFDRLGFGRVQSIPVMLETLKLLHVAGPLPSGRIASVSCSGGEACLMADAAEGTGLRFPDFGPETRSTLQETLGPRVAIANPLDYHTYIWGNAEATARVFETVATPEVDLTCAVLDFPRSDRCDPDEWMSVFEILLRVRARTGRALAVVSTLTETLPEEVSMRAVAGGVVPFAGVSEAMEAMATAARIGRISQEPAPILVPRGAQVGRTLTEFEAKSILARAGLEVPRGTRVEDADAAQDAALAIGFPVVLKGAGVAHKTEAGAVHLNLHSKEEVAAAARKMPARSLLVEEMIGGHRVELLLGVVCDPAHGYVLTLGAGGLWTELLKDTVSLLVPVTRADVETALAHLRTGAALTGYRGAPAASMDAIWRAVDAVQGLVAASPEPIVELEINPLLCTPERAVVADALITLGETDD